MQPKFHVLGATEENSKNMDLSLSEIVDAYEEKFGEIALNDCDFKLFSNPKVKCKGSAIIPIDQADEIIVSKRNNYIISNILKEDKDKIILVYGKGHYPGMHKLLMEGNYQIIDSLKQ